MLLFTRGRVRRLYYVSAVFILLYSLLHKSSAGTSPTTITTTTAKPTTTTPKPTTTSKPTTMAKATTAKPTTAPSPVITAPGAVTSGQTGGGGGGKISAGGAGNRCGIFKPVGGYFPECNGSNARMQGRPLIPLVFTAVMCVFIVL